MLTPHHQKDQGKPSASSRHILCPTLVFSCLLELNAKVIERDYKPEQKQNKTEKILHFLWLSGTMRQTHKTKSFLPLQIGKFKVSQARTTSKYNKQEQHGRANTE
jgi:hypothetical protein